MSAGPVIGGAGEGPSFLRQEFLSILRTEYDDHVAQFFDTLFESSHFHLEYHRSTRRFQIVSLSAKPQNLSLKCKILFITVKLGIVVPPLLEGEFTEVKKKGKLYKRIRLDLSGETVHYDSHSSNPFVKLLAREQHDDLLSIDMLAESTKADHHTLILNGKAWETDLNSKNLDLVAKEEIK